MSHTLLVCVPGLKYGIARWKPLIAHLKEDLSLDDDDILTWEHHCSYLSTSYASQLSSDLAAEIDAKFSSQVQTGNPFTKIILMGHSVGAILIRQAFLLGLGSDTNRMRRQTWTDHVERIVLLAGINRGLFPPEEQDTRKQPYRKARWIGRQIIEIVSVIPFVHLLAEDILAGSPFITNLRLWWMRKVWPMPRPLVVQLVGTEDGLVRASDSLDISQDSTGIQLFVPHTDHATIIDIENQGKFDEARYVQIRRALLDDLDTSEPPINVAETKKLVVFVLHGIRATNRGWVEKAARDLAAQLPSAEVVRPTYNYFSALDFLLPISRRYRLRWFRDTYAYYLSRNPSAEFRILAHSNGTYLLGQSLAELSGMTFAKAVLAGSVLPTQFKWREVIANKQVNELWNHCARFDFPVGILCSALRSLGMKDIGTGGYNGFSLVPNADINCQFHSGGHGSALDDESRSGLVQQVAGKEFACKKVSNKSWFDYLSRMAVLLPIVVIALIGWLSFYWLGPIAAHMFNISKSLGVAVAIGCFLALLSAFLNFIDERGTVEITRQRSWVSLMSLTLRSRAGLHETTLN
jgi:pimeloyl-ACP methyl ester carboxylesterase